MRIIESYSMSKIMMRDAVVREVEFFDVTKFKTFFDEMVVTYRKNGEPLSRFGDDIWDYSATSRTIKSINFRARLNKAGLDQSVGEDNLNQSIRFMKTFTLHWLNAIGGCSMSKLYGDIIALSHLVSFCVQKNICFNRIFSSPMALDFMVSTVSTDKQVGVYLGKLQRFSDTAIVMHKHAFWSDLKPSSTFISKLSSVRKTFPETTGHSQTLLIPSGIYQDVLKNVMESLDLFIRYSEKIEYVFSMRSQARDKGVSLDIKPTFSQLTTRQSARINFYWRKTLNENPKVKKALEELARVGISKNATWSGLVERLSIWQVRCGILIAAFTGMRKSEILAIPLNGLKTLNTNSGDIPIVWSYTTKLESNNSPRYTKWVTSPAVEAAFNVARVITKGVLNWSDDRPVIVENEQDVPLFISAEHGKKGRSHPQFKFTVPSFNSGSIIKSVDPDTLQISEQDVAEIDWFLYGENLPNNIKVGGQWNLTLHQFRRSMAVYAASSGLVSYPALKEQLKHISMMMTVYYSDSSSRAVNILGDGPEKKSICSEWLDAKARVESDDLHELLNNNLPLAGSAGKRLRNLQVKKELPTFLDSRKQTKKAVKNGKIRYRSTLVGGCMSIAPCNKGAGVLASACISCEHAVFLPGSKVALEQTKEFYASQIEKGVPTRVSQEYFVNIKKIDSFLENLTEVQGHSIENK